MSAMEPFADLAVRLNALLLKLDGMLEELADTRTEIDRIAAATAIDEPSPSGDDEEEVT